jgi:hypothetical protein
MRRVAAVVAAGLEHAKGPRWVVFSAASLIVVSGCGMFAEETVAPEQRALEVVVAGSGPKGDRCQVNYAEVGAGNHPVAIIASDGQATVRIVNGSGLVVFQADSVSPQQPSSAGSDEEPVMVAADESSQTVRLDAGEYQVECLSGGSTFESPLHVVLTRPDR